MAGMAFTLGTMATSPAHADPKGFNKIASNMVDSIASLPGLISGLAYLFGTLIGVLGVLKIKEHVENPQQAPLKDGAIRLAAGGALFALPILYEAMFVTVGDIGDSTTKAAKLNEVTFKTLP